MHHASLCPGKNSQCKKSQLPQSFRAPQMPGQKSGFENQQRAQVVRQSQRSEPRPSKFAFCFFLQLLIRVGEASLPGPWGIGAVNSSGLTGKAEKLTSLPKQGIFACSETALTTDGERRFSCELRAQCNHFRFHGGEPAPYRSPSSFAVGGKQVGVGFLASCPFRPISRGWNPELYATSRIAASRFFLGNEWITGGALYGYALKSDTKEVRQQTDELLHELVHQVAFKSRGRRFIAGDFNQVPGVLTAVERLQSMGWKELQDIAQHKWGTIPSVTCKHATRKDFVYVSPELQDDVIAVEVQHDVFKDHAILVGTFRDLQPPPKARIWPKCTPIPWTSELSQAVQSCSEAQLPHVPEAIGSEPHFQPTKVVQQVCAAFEQTVHQAAQTLAQPGLFAQHRGRGQFVEPVVQTAYVSPLRPSRRGERTPASDVCSLTYKRWFTQLRRLKSYVRHMQNNVDTVTRQIHRVSLWKAIRFAPGFGSDFVTWWPTRPCQVAGSPQEIPHAPPPFAEAQRILWAFEAVVDAYEAELHQKDQQLRLQKGKTDPNLVYRDVQSARPEPVTSLVTQKRAVVVAVEEDSSVIFEPAVQFQAQIPLVTPVGQCEVIHVDTDQAWLSDVAELNVGDEISQDTYIGSTEGLHTLFTAEWIRRWDKHLHVPLHHWDRVGSFIEKVVEGGVMELQPLTFERWLVFAKSRKRYAATGLDSLSRTDVLNMPQCFADKLLECYSHAQKFGRWPKQWVAGAVHSLQKTVTATTVGQYRPITIYPFMYRLWSSLRAREVIAFLTPYAPDSLWGSRPKVSAQSFWWRMQAVIEQAIYDQIPLSGWIVDIVKAFNEIPRDPVFRAAVFMGIHADIIRPWVAFSYQAKRYFSIRGTLSPGVASCTGFAEGCGLSVCAMMLLNFVIHRWMYLLWPQVEFHTYVDNFEVVVQDDSMFDDALVSLMDIARTLDIQVDCRKTFGWSLQAGTRARVKAGEHALQYAAKDLGGHMNYCNRKTNFSVQGACRSLDTFWRRLGQSRASVVQKVRAIRTVAWPRALHAIASVSLGKQWFDKMRTGAAKALHWQRAGSNPMIQLSLLNAPRTDPECYALYHSLLAFRRHADFDTGSDLFHKAVELPARQRPPGPHGVLLTRLQSIHWRHEKGTCFVDHLQRPIDVLHAPPQEIRWRVSQAWQHYIGMQMMVRKHFAGLENVEPWFVQKSLQHRSPDHVGLLRAL